MCKYQDQGVIRREKRFPQVLACYGTPFVSQEGRNVHLLGPAYSLFPIIFRSANEGAHLHDLLAAVAWHLDYWMSGYQKLE